eukprot:7961362-Pyramimonas_sp.AAC.1
MWSFFSSPLLSAQQDLSTAGSCKFQPGLYALPGHWAKATLAARCRAAGNTAVSASGRGWGCCPYLG